MPETLIEKRTHVNIVRLIFRAPMILYKCKSTYVFTITHRLIRIPFSDVVVTVIEKVQNRKQTISDKHLMKNIIRNTKCNIKIKNKIL